MAEPEERLAEGPEESVLADLALDYVDAAFVGLDPEHKPPPAAVRTWALSEGERERGKEVIAAWLRAGSLGPLDVWLTQRAPTIGIIMWGGAILLSRFFLVLEARKKKKTELAEKKKQEETVPAEAGASSTVDPPTPESEVMGVIQRSKP